MRGMKKFVIGFLLGAILFGSVGAYASNSKMLEVFYNIKDIKIDRASSMPAEAPFTYRGTTYVPLRYISESFGKDVKWDGPTQTIHIGEMDSAGTMNFGSKGLEHMSYQSSNSFAVYGKGVFNNNIYLRENANSELTIEDLIGNKYANFFYLGFGGYISSGNTGHVAYPLNGQYSTFEATVALSASSRSTQGSIQTNIYADDKLVKEIVIDAGTFPEDIKLNVKNVNALKFEVILLESTGSSRDNTIIFGNPRVTK